MRSVILLLASALCASAAWPNGYAYRRTITVQTSQVPSTQSNFPMLISGTYDGTSSKPDLRTLANSGKVQSACNQTTIVISVGCDVIFTSDAAGSTLLNFEWETYNSTTGAVNIWVKVPSISDGTVIYMFYGNASVSTFQGSVTGTWDSNYKGVWHLPNGSSLSIADSTNLSTGTNTGATATTGAVDGAAAIGATHYISTGAVQGKSFTGLTAELWVYTSSAAGSQTALGTFTSNTDMSFDIDVAGGTAAIMTNLKGAVTARANLTQIGTYSLNTWHHVALVWDGSNQIIYIDGSQNTSAGYSDTALSGTVSSFFTIGAYQPSAAAQNTLGNLDEVRVSNIPRSANWITAEYNNQFAPASFYAFGSEAMAGIGSLIIP